MAVLEYVQQKKLVENIKNGVLRKFPLLGATMANLTFEPNKNIQTAGTDGKKVVYSPEFVQKLSYDERVCLFSHEIMHDAFDHIMRSKGKDPELWNQATDAVINQMLKAANLPLPEGGVDIPEAAGKSAEEMYEILHERKMQQQQQQQNGQGQSGENSDDQQQEGGQGQPQENQQGKGAGQHNMWEEAVKQAEKEQQEQQGQGQGQGEQGDKEQDQSGQGQGQSKGQDDQSQSSQRGSGTPQRSSATSSMSSSEMEKIFTEANEELKQEIGERIREQLRKQKEEMLERGEGSGGYTSQFEDVGEAAAVLSWKKILKRELEKEEDRWTYRRADEDNDYQARIGTLEVEDYPETEVMLDVSGSVDDDFLKGFLRQLKPLLKESKLRVGCFDEFVYDFVDIKSSKDIDHFKVTRRSTWTENWDAAVRSFSKKKGVNKIVFTDGNPCPGVMPKEDLSKINVLWLVFDNKSFKPCCGKVIFVNRHELEYMTSKPKTDDFELTM